jgi:hypothetical protein
MNNSLEIIEDLLLYIELKKFLAIFEKKIFAGARAIDIFIVC